MSIKFEPFSIENMPVCDVKVRSISWGDKMPHVTLVLELPSGSDDGPEFVQVEFRWVSKFIANFSFSENMIGPPMTWDAQFSASTCGWHAELDFGSNGSVEIDCNEIGAHYLESLTSPS
jgi:hypothetical protein